MTELLQWYDRAHMTARARASERVSGTILPNGEGRGRSNDSLVAAVSSLSAPLQPPTECCVRANHDFTGSAEELQPLECQMEESICAWS